MVVSDTSTSLTPDTCCSDAEAEDLGVGDFVERGVAVGLAVAVGRLVGVEAATVAVCVDVGDTGEGRVADGMTVSVDDVILSKGGDSVPQAMMKIAAKSNSPPAASLDLKYFW